MKSAVQFGRLHVIKYGAAAETAFSANPVPTTWTEVDISEYVPLGCPGFMGSCNQEEVSGYERWIMHLTIDNSLAVTSWRVGTAFCMDHYPSAGHCRQTLQNLAIPLNKDRKFWYVCYSTDWQGYERGVRILGYWMP